MKFTFTILALLGAVICIAQGNAQNACILLAAGWAITAIMPTAMESKLIADGNKLREDIQDLKVIPDQMAELRYALAAKNHQLDAQRKEINTLCDIIAVHRAAIKDGK